MDQIVASTIDRLRLDPTKLPTFVKQTPELLAVWIKHVGHEPNLLSAFIAFTRECRKIGLDPWIPKKAPNIVSLLGQTARAQAQEAMKRLVKVLRETRLLENLKPSSRYMKKGNPFVMFILLEPQRQMKMQEILKSLDRYLYRIALPPALQIEERLQYNKPKVMNPTASSIKQAVFKQTDWFEIDRVGHTWIGCRTVKEGILVRMQFDLFNADHTAVEAVRKVLQTIRY